MHTKPGPQAIFGWVLALACACSDAHRDTSQPDAAAAERQPDAAAAEPEPDAAAAEPEPDAVTSASHSEVIAYEKSVLGRAPHPAQPSRPLTSEEAEWAAATDFEIEFETGLCFGQCPVYNVRFSSNGEVRLTGYQKTWKPGVYFFQRSAADARTLYQNLILRGLLDLTPICMDRDSWHNVIGPTDATPKLVTLRAGGREHKVGNMDSCGSKQMTYGMADGMEQEIVDAAAIEPYLITEWVDFGCTDRIDSKAFLAGAVIRGANNRAVGLLQIKEEDREVDLRLTTCDGEPIARVHASRWGCGVALIPADRMPFAWPGVTVRSAGAVLPDLYAGRKEFPIILHTFDAEYRQSAEPGATCQR